jgi:hypothetical protein
VSPPEQRGRDIAVKRASCCVIVVKGELSWASGPSESGRGSDRMGTAAGPPCWPVSRSQCRWVPSVAGTREKPSIGGPNGPTLRGSVGALAPTDLKSSSLRILLARRGGERDAKLHWRGVVFRSCGKQTVECARAWAACSARRQVDPMLGAHGFTCCQAESDREPGCSACLSCTGVPT